MTSIHCGWIVIILVGATFNVSLVSSASQEDCHDSSCCHISSETLLRPKVRDLTCYTGPGHDYRGTVAVTEMNQTCINWLKTVAANLSPRDKRRYGIADNNFCRNPEPTENKGPWCYVSPNNYGYCNVLSCLDYPDIDRGELVPSPSCKADPAFMLPKPGIVFALEDSVYFLTIRQDGVYLDNYVIYKFDDATMTSFGAPAIQTAAEAFNLCIRKHDVITFVTSDEENVAFVYMQTPNVMLMVDFLKRGWRKVDEEIYEDCIDPIRQAAKVGSSEETLMKSLFNFNKPHSVFIETNGYRFECVWKNKTLILKSQDKAKLDECVDYEALFVDKTNTTFAISRIQDECGTNTSNGNSPETNNIISSLFEAVAMKPALAAPLLGYRSLNNDSLVKLYGNSNKTNSTKQRCDMGGTSRNMRVYNGQQIDDMIGWLRPHGNLSVEVSINTLNTRRADYCVKQNKRFCCGQILTNVRSLRNSENYMKVGEGNFWIRCQLEFVSSPSGNESCPTLSCFHDHKNRDDVYVLCEIRLSPDPPSNGNVTLEDILGIKNGQEISYEDAYDASAKLGEIADSLRHPVEVNNLELGVLIGSVKALAPVNYTELSSSGTKQLINDFVMIVDNLADEKRVKEWISIKSEEGPGVKDEDKEIPPTKGPRSIKQQDPQSLLFITEHVLEQVVAGSGVGMWADSIVTVKTQNVISKISQKYFNSTNSIDDSNPVERFNDSSSCSDFDLTLSPSSADPSLPAVIITSSFPNIIQVIAKVNEEKESSSDVKCSNEYSCDKGGDTLLVPNSPVISATVMQNNKKISSFIRFNIPYIEKDLPDPQANDKKYYFSCTYLTDDNEWDTNGCQATNVDVDNHHVTCRCNHTTNFAILLQVIPPKVKDTDMAILVLISYIGESLSVFCLIITLVIFGAFRRSLKSERIVAHFHLVASLIIFHVIQLFSSNAENAKATTAIPCIIVAFSTHFSLLAAFMWMLCEGITLHFSVIDVFHAMTTFKLLRYFIGWGIPLIISGVALAYGLSMKPYPTCYLQGIGEQSCLMGNTQSFYPDTEPHNQVIERCWLSTESHLVWTLVVPAMIVLVLNMIVLIRVSIVISQSSKATNQIHRPSSEKKQDLEHIRKSVKGAIILMPILGIPWIFGLIPQALTHVTLLYIFTILNSTQGILILLFYCILNNEVRTVVIRSLRKRKLNQQQQNWSSHSNHRNHSLDLRQLSSDFEQKIVSGVQRSVSTNTNSTYLGSGSPIGPESSFGGSYGEQTTFLSVNNRTYKGNSSPESGNAVWFPCPSTLYPEDSAESVERPVSADTYMLLRRDTRYITGGGIRPASDTCRY